MKSKHIGVKRKAYSAKTCSDTNIIISAALSDTGNPSIIFKMISDGKLHLCYNAQILSEYTDVLSRDKFNFSPEKQKTFVDKIVEIGIVVNTVSSDISLPDESDRVFYDTAKACKGVLITGNTKHYPNEPFIFTPKDFLKTLCGE